MVTRSRSLYSALQHISFPTATAAGVTIADALDEYITVVYNAIAIVSADATPPSTSQQSFADAAIAA